jgi:hypothetical protein
VAVQQAWIPSSGWFVFLGFVMLGFVGAYFSGQVLVMIGTSVIGAFLVSLSYRGKM